MISYLHGSIRNIFGDHLVLDVGGVGYELMVTPGLASFAAERLGEPLDVHVYSFIQGLGMGSGRFVLIGFQEYVDRQLFEKLIQVSGIGPKAALRCMIVPSRDLAEAIDQGNIPYLRKLPGLGARTAEKVIAQLKGKLYDILLAKPSAAPAVSPEKEFIADARSVLAQLGYAAAEAQAMIDGVLADRPDITEFQDLIREIYQRQAQTDRK